MTNATISNQDLAQFYFRAMAPYSDADKMFHYKKVSRAVGGAEIDIASFYDEQGSLKHLRVPGISQVTKATLELILEKGVEEAIKMTIEARTAKLAATPISKHRLHDRQKLQSAEYQRRRQ